MNYKAKSLFMDSISERRIMSYAWGGVESGENSDEYLSVARGCVSAGYDTLMTSYGLTMQKDGSINQDHIFNTLKSFETAKSLELKLIPRFYISIVPEVLEGDYWSTGEHCPKYPDPFSDKDISSSVMYYKKLLSLFKDIDNIIAFCPTFGFLGQSLFDGGNFDGSPLKRCCGYSENAKIKFNERFGFSGELPIPFSDGEMQDHKTVLWFKFRQQQMTEYAKRILEACIGSTDKPVGMFSESYPATFAHLSEASLIGDPVFLLQDCTFGCETYNMANTLSETHGDVQNFNSFENYRDTIMPRLINASKKGNKLMGFWWRTKPDYSFKLLPTLISIEERFREYDFSVSKNVGIVFTSNYSSTALPTEPDRPFSLDNSYLLAANYPIEFIENDMPDTANWHMVSELELISKDLSVFDLVIISDYSFFEANEWSIIEKYALAGVRFLFPGEFARSKRFRSDLKYSGHDLAGTIEFADPHFSILSHLDGMLLRNPHETSFNKFSLGLTYKGTFHNQVTLSENIPGSRDILTLSGMPLFCELQDNIFCVPNSLFRLAACFGGDHKIIADTILRCLIITNSTSQGEHHIESYT